MITSGQASHQRNCMSGLKWDIENWIFGSEMGPGLGGTPPPKVWASNPPPPTPTPPPPSPVPGTTGHEKKEDILVSTIKWLCNENMFSILKRNWHYAPGHSLCVKVYVIASLFPCLRAVSLFKVGCGAIGCEMLKNLALLGVAIGEHGLVSLREISCYFNILCCQLKSDYLLFI